MKSYILCILLIASYKLTAQDRNKVLVRNAGIIEGKQTVSIKWYAQELLYPDGVNIYRKEGNGNWERVKSQTIKRMNDLPDSIYQKDDDFHFFVPIIKESKKEDIKGLVLFQVLVKSWESEIFSKFLGIMYNDNTVQAGKTYIYKVNRITGNAESLIAESPAITAGQVQIGEPVKDITVKTDTNKVKIKWKPEEQRFFAVNIYRSTDDRQWEKIRKRPLVISKYRDTLGNLRYPEIFAEDDSLETGIYYYQLAGVDFFGKETKRSESFKAEIKDLIPPSAPEELKDSVNNLNVFLRWKNTEIKDIAGINIYRSIKSSGPFIKVNPTLLPVISNQYQDKVEKAGPYYYYVSSVDKAGNEAKSRPVFAEVHDIVPPSKPMGLVAKADTGRIALSWQMNKEADLMGYSIYRTANKNDKNNFVLLNANPIKANSFTDKLPASAKNKFLYKIIAVDTSYNKSESSEIVSVQMPDIIPPVKPLIKNIDNLDNAVNIYWLSNKDADLMGYDVYRGTTGNNYFKINSQLISSSQTRFTDRTIESGKEYFYYLVAIDSAGNQSQPSDIQKGLNNYPTLSSSPQDIKLKYREDKKDIQISWKLERPDGLAGVVVYRKIEEKDKFMPLSGNLSENEFLDKDVKVGNTYYY